MRWAPRPRSPDLIEAIAGAASYLELGPRLGLSSPAWFGRLVLSIGTPAFLSETSSIFCISDKEI